MPAVDPSRGPVSVTGASGFVGFVCTSRELGLETHAIEDTLRETGQTMIGLGFLTPKPG